VGALWAVVSGEAVLLAIVAAREVRECLVSLNGLLTKAEGGSGGMTIAIEVIGGGSVETK
jgi:hypothetical protein